MTTAAPYATSGEARAAAANILADADRLAESEEQQRLDAALSHQSKTMTAAAAAKATASTMRCEQLRMLVAEATRVSQQAAAQAKEVRVRLEAEIKQLKATMLIEQHASQQAAAEATRVSQQAAAEATRVSQQAAAEATRVSQQAAAEAKEVRVRLEAESKQLKATIAALKREGIHATAKRKETECRHEVALQTMGQECSRRIKEREAAAEAPSPVEAPAVAPASPPAAAAPKPTAPTADRADPAEAGALPAAQAMQEGADARTPAEEPPASSGRAEEQQSGGIPSDFATKLLNDPSYAGPLPGSDARKGKPLPRIPPDKLSLLEKLLVDLPQVLTTLLPAQPELVKEGMRLAMDYLTKGGGAACVSPWESWAKVSCTWTVHVYCM